MKFQWSPSRIITYETCPRQYEAKFITKTTPFKDTPHTIWGKSVHDAMEAYVKDGVPLPKNMEMYSEYAEKIRKLPGQKTTEGRFTLTKELTPTTWRNKSAWGRAQVDLIYFPKRDPKLAIVIDYKTGKVPQVRRDNVQLIVYALFTFAHYPSIERISAAFCYLSHGVAAEMKMSREGESEQWKAIKQKLQVIEQDTEFLPSPSGLCRGWCPVKSCEFNKEKI